MFEFKKRKRSYVFERSNVIQYDCMGHPLRLVIDNHGEQLWLDTEKQDGDVVLEWTEVNQ